MRIGRAVTLFSLLAAPFASCSNIENGDTEDPSGALAQVDRCHLNPGSCDGSLSPQGRFRSKIGRPSRVSGLWFGEDSNYIWGGYYVGSINGDVSFYVVKYGAGSWDLFLFLNGQHFLTANKREGQSEALAEHRLAELPLQDVATDELMLSVAEFFGNLGERYQGTLVDRDEQRLPLPNCELELEIELDRCPPNAGTGPIFGGKCRVYAKIKAKIKCKPPVTVTTGT